MHKGTSFCDKVQISYYNIYKELCYRVRVDDIIFRIEGI